MRGASQCLGYLNQRELYEACLDADGWFDTGDLARTTAAAASGSPAGGRT